MDSLSAHAYKHSSISLHQCGFTRVSLSDDKGASEVHTSVVKGRGWSGPVRRQHTHTLLEWKSIRSLTGRAGSADFLQEVSEVRDVEGGGENGSQRRNTCMAVGDMKGRN